MFISLAVLPCLVLANHPDDPMVHTDGVLAVATASSSSDHLRESQDGSELFESREHMLVMATIERPPFVMVQTDGALRGFSVDLWERIAERAGIQYRYELETEFATMLEKVQNRTVDGAVANITITAERERSMDFSLPIYNSGLQIVVPRETDLFSVWKPLVNQQVWQVVVVLVLIWVTVLHLLWLAGRKTHVLFRNQYPHGLVDAFLWATAEQLRRDVPYSTQFQLTASGLRVVTTLSIFIVVAVFASYLTVDNLRGSVTTYEDLFGKEVGVTHNSSQETFLATHNIPSRAYETLTELKTDLETGQLDAAVLDAPVAQYYVATDGAGKVKLVHGVFRPEQFGILFQAHHPLRERVNEVLLEMQEDGTYQSLYDSWFGI